MSGQPSLPGLDSGPPRDSLFFALLPDAPTAARIEPVARELYRSNGLTGSLQPRDRLHVTLCPLRTYHGVPRGLVADASAAASSLHQAPFTFAFDEAKTFGGGERKPWALSGKEYTGPLLAFRDALVVALAAQAVSMDRSSSYTPHVTLGYDQSKINERTVKPVRWDVAEFVLIHSLQGASRYVVLGRWPLGA